MSYWLLESTADVGIRGFATTPESLIRELTLGMQHLQLEQNSLKSIDAITRFSGIWTTPPLDHDAYDLLCVSWLDEVLFQSEVQDRFLVDLVGKISSEHGKLQFSGQVSYIECTDVVKSTEIKAVTTHALSFFKLEDKQISSHPQIDIPVIEGPGWVGDVYFDI